MTNIEKVCQFLDEAQTYYLATAEGDQPRVRPFGTALIFENRLYIQTGKSKPVSRQLAANPKVEICAFNNGNGCGSPAGSSTTTAGSPRPPCWTRCPA